MNKELFAEYFVQRFPEYTNELKFHLEEYGELLGHVFFGVIINSQIVQLLRTDSNPARTKLMLDFVNELYLEGDDECKNIVVVTILEYLGDDKEVLKKALDYLDLELQEESRRVERFLGRD